MVGVMEMPSNTKYTPLRVLLKIFYVATYFKCKLQMKLRKNKTYCAVIVNLQTGCLQ
jgi:hypothetical protein